MPPLPPGISALLAGGAVFNASKEVGTGIPVDAPEFPVEAPWQHGAAIPERFTCDGDEISPGFQLPALPSHTTHLALLMEDPDAPRGTWVHWLWWDAPAGDIQEDSQPGVSGKNSWGSIGYGGPCPPSGGHRYFVHVYALSTPLGLPAGSDKAAVAAALPGKVLGHGSVMGTFAR